MVVEQQNILHARITNDQITVTVQVFIPAVGIARAADNHALEASEHSDLPREAK